MRYAPVDNRHEEEGEPRRTSPWMLLVRYGLGAVMVVGGLVMVIISPADLGFDGFAMAAGGGLSVVLLNVLFRMGVSSESDREREAQARTYFDEHGEWPEEKPSEGRRWTLPAGVVTYDQEQERLRARRDADRDTDRDA